MLGFTTFSQTPLSQALTAVNALAFSGNVSVTGVVENFADVDAQAVLYISSTYATNVISALADVDAQATTVIPSISLYSYASNFTDVDAQASFVLQPVVSTGFAQDFADVDAKANANLGNTSATISASPFADVDAQANTSLGSVYLTHYVNDSFVFEGIANVVLVGSELSLYNNSLSTTAVKFPYEDYADQYDRRQTLVLVGHPTNATAYVRYENPTYYIAAETVSPGDTVHIKQENNIVYIRELPESTTVVIAA